MKTIKEVADICGRSKSSVNRIIKELNIKIERVGNTNYITDDDLRRICVFWSIDGLIWEEKNSNQTKSNHDETKSNQIKPESTETVSNVSSVPEEEKENYIKILLEQIKMLQEDNKDLREDNKSLRDENKSLRQSNTIALNQLLLLQSKQPEAEETQEPEEEIIIVPEVSNSKEPEQPKKKWWEFWK